MKVFSYTINTLLIIIVVLTLTAAIGTAIFHKPVLFTVIKSDSMYPLWQRGDMLVIRNVSEDAPIQKSDMILFKAEKGALASKGWIAHRVVGGNKKSGFITKGDANPKSDQASGEAPPIQRKWIAAKVVTIGGSPLVLPKIGYLTLWTQKLQSAKFIMPMIALFLVGILAYGELTNRKKGKRNKKLDLQLMYIGAGITIMIVAGATMLMNSLFVELSYGVGGKQGVLSGSDVGIMQMGSTKTGKLSEFQNSGIVSFVGVVNEKDPQITVNHPSFVLSTGESLNLQYTVHAQKKGDYQSEIKVGLFYPLLPYVAIQKLASINYWLALSFISVIPGLPFVAYPFIDRKLRRPMGKRFRKRVRKLFY